MRKKSRCFRNDGLREIGSETKACGIVAVESFTINVRADIFSSGEGGLDIFKKRSDISILAAFSSGHFRSREG